MSRNCTSPPQTWVVSVADADAHASSKLGASCSTEPPMKSSAVPGVRRPFHRAARSACNPPHAFALPVMQLRPATPRHLAQRSKPGAERFTERIDELHPGVPTSISCASPPAIACGMHATADRPRPATALPPGAARYPAPAAQIPRHAVAPERGRAAAGYAEPDPAQL